MIVHTNVGSAIRDLAPRRRTQRKALRRALIRTYNICGEAFYPRWRAFFLDRAFQAQGAGRLLACYLDKRACQTPDELGKFWADQALMPWLSAPTKQRHVAESVEVAAGFLRRLEAELCAERELRGMFSCNGL